ncbi:hypothetical protein C8R43DRAFT_1017137 [Mycena crocata]|nr:hypothetical protein C8R43DRAFT_1017137 [Mycena crocata]
MTHANAVARAFTIILLLTAGLFGLEKAVSFLGNLLSGFATGRRFVLFFVTSAATVCSRRFLHNSRDHGTGDEYDYLFEEDPVDSALSPEYYEDDSESDTGSTDSSDPPPSPPAGRGPSFTAPRSFAPSPSMASRTSAFSNQGASEFTRSYGWKTPIASQDNTNLPFQPTQSPPNQPRNAAKPSFSPQMYTSAINSRGYTQRFTQSVPTSAAQPQIHSNAILQQFAQSASAQYSFAPHSSFLSQYMVSLPKTVVTKPFRYTPSKPNANPEARFVAHKDARFPVSTGLADAPHYARPSEAASRPVISRPRAARNLPGSSHQASNAFTTASPNSNLTGDNLPHSSPSGAVAAGLSSSSTSSVDGQCLASAAATIGTWVPANVRVPETPSLPTHFGPNPILRSFAVCTAGSSNADRNTECIPWAAKGKWTEPETGLARVVAVQHADPVRTANSFFASPPSNAGAHPALLAEASKSAGGFNFPLVSAVPVDLGGKAETPTGFVPLIRRAV